MKSKELKNYNLPENRAYNEAIEAKPMVLLLVIMGIGFILMLLKEYIVGISLFLLGASCLIFLPNRRIIEFYDEYMILYNKARKDEFNVVYYDDVKSWDYKTRVSMDELTITLNDDSIQKIDAFSRIEFENDLNKYLKDKKVVYENRSNRLRNSK